MQDINTLQLSEGIQMITGETLIKGLFYFMLKAGRMGGKYRSKKKVAGKDGKMKWQYDYGKKNAAKKKVNPADIQKYKDKELHKPMDEDIILIDDTEPTPKEKRANRTAEAKQRRASMLTPEQELAQLKQSLADSKIIHGDDEENLDEDDNIILTDEMDDYYVPDEENDSIILIDEDEVKSRIKKLEKQIEAKKKKNKK